MDINMIGIRIKEKRKELGLTPKMINELAGIRTGHLSELENGKSLPSTPTLLKLSELLNCSVDWILFGESRNSEFSDITLSTRETELINIFKKLSMSDQDELLDLAEIKYQRTKRKTEKSSFYQNINNTNATA